MNKEQAVSFDEAVNLSLSLATSKPHKAWVSIFDALGRTLAREIVCKKNLPSYNNAAMDGFAFKHGDNLGELNIKTTILAGQIVEPCLRETECYKIMTGAKVPDDADTIIPFEDCVSYDENKIVLSSSIKKGNALRLMGEEERVGSILLEEGTCLNSRDIALLASQGISMVEVYKKLQIAVFQLVMNLNHLGKMPMKMKFMTSMPLHSFLCLLNTVLLHITVESFLII